MLLKVFTIFDSKVGAYLQPFFMQATGQAIRAMEELANDPQHQFSKFPADFTLFEVGTYDQKTGLFENLKAHINLGVMIQFKRKPVEPAPLFQQGATN